MIRLLAVVLAMLPVCATAQDAAAGMAVVARETGFNGIILTSRGTQVVTGVYGQRVPSGITAAGPTAFRVDDLWRWASITKQVVAVIAMQEVAAGRIDLDLPIATYLPKFKGPTAGQITMRRLLRHQSGLPNPSDASDGSSDVPAFYTKGYSGDRNPLTGFCAGVPKGSPADQWSYNNCDFMVAGAVLEAVTHRSWAQLVDERIAKRLKLPSLRTFPRPEPTMAGYENGMPEAPQDLSAYGASAGLSGTINDLWRFDRALMTGALVPPAQLAEMWDGQVELGYIALGQWVYTVPVKGCPAAVRIVERRGQIGGVETRNFILPDKDMVVIAFTNRDGFDFGEIWQGKGFSHDLIAKVACT